MDNYRIIRLAEVLRLTGLSRTTIWRREKAGTFPRRVRLGRHAVGWHYAEVAAWLNSRERVVTASVGTLADHIDGQGDTS